MTGPGFVRFSGTGFFRQVFVAGSVFFLLLVLVPPAAAGILDLNNPDSTGNSLSQTTEDQTTFMTLPAIIPNDTPGFFVREYSFPFRQENITVPINVSAALYYGAKNGDKFATTRSGGPPETLAPGYYRAFVNDPAQEMLYTDLLNRFRSIRQEHRYTDDEYAELLSVFVQSLPYDNVSAAHKDTLSRFPAETLVDGIGDCDDKSVLLAGLLSREGYNVSLLLFIPEHHMAVGLESDCLQYNNTGYLFIETTGFSFMGDVPKRLNLSEKYNTDDRLPGTTPLTSVPLVIRVGPGSGNFSRAGETGYIIAWKNRIDLRIASLKEQINTIPPENLPRFRVLLETYNTYADVHNYIAKHRYDRAGTYRYLRSVLQPARPGSRSYVAQLVTPPKPAIPSITESPVDDPARSCISTPRLPDDLTAFGNLPCPRGTRVSRQCQWQNIRQELLVSS